MLGPCSLAKPKSLNQRNKMLLALFSLVAAQSPPSAFFTLLEASPGANCSITNGGTCISNLNHTNSSELFWRVGRRWLLL